MLDWRMVLDVVTIILKNNYKYSLSIHSGMQQNLFDNIDTLSYRSDYEIEQQGGYKTYYRKSRIFRC